MKYLIVGLGNIGSSYEGTRHNIGFDIVNTWSKEQDFEFETQRLALCALTKWKGRFIYLIKPTTYMNLSGKSVRYWMHKISIPVQNILILVDDISLPFGTIRIKSKGSDGGHNGLKNIQSILGHNHYPRLRFGIGNDFDRGRQADYVLGKWSREEQIKLPIYIDKSIDVIKDFTTIGIERTMNTHNRK